jgi:hypothetical protein
MLHLWRPRRAQHSPPTKRQTVLRVEPLEARDLPSAQVLGSASPCVLPSHEPSLIAITAGPVGGPERAAADAAEGPRRSLWSSFPTILIGGVANGRLSIPVPGPSRETALIQPPDFESLSRAFEPHSASAGLTLSLLAANDLPGAGDAVTNALSRPAADVRNAALPSSLSPANADALRGVTTAVVGAGIGAAEGQPARAVAELFALGAAAPVDAALSLPQNLAAGLPKNAAATLLADGTPAQAVAPAPVAPAVAELLKPAAAWDPSKPLLALQQLLPGGGEPKPASVLARLLRWPYLPGAVVAVAALEAFRRYVRRSARRPAATELPEITGPRGL